MSDKKKINPDELIDDEIIKYEKEETTFDRSMTDDLKFKKLNLEEEEEVKSPGDFTRLGPYIYYQWCKGCGICIDVCPKDVLAFDSNNHIFQQNPEKCIRCMICDAYCPDFAITGFYEEENE